MSFNGKLIEFYDSDNDKYDKFDLGYVFKESYKISPNRRQDLDSTRNANGVLQRNVLDHTASTISFETKTMWNTDLATMMAFIKAHYTVEKEKKVKLRYYCPDTDSYSTGQFYIPDIEFPIMRVDTDNTRIMYSSFTLEFIEY